MQAITDEFDPTEPRVNDLHKLLVIRPFFHGLRIGEALGLCRGVVEVQDGAIRVHVRGNCYRSKEAGVGMVRKDTVNGSRLPYRPHLPEVL